MAKSNYKKGDFVKCIPGYTNDYTSDRKLFGGSGYIEEREFTISSITIQEGIKKPDRNILWPEEKDGIGGCGVFEECVESVKKHKRIKLFKKR